MAEWQEERTSAFENSRLYSLNYSAKRGGGKWAWQGCGLSVTSARRHKKRGQDTR